MDDQDWTVVTINRNRRTVGSGSKPYSEKGSQIRPKIVSAKSAISAANTKLEETEIGKLKTLSAESRNEIVQKRVALGKTQILLAQDCRLTANIMRDIENGRYCPTQTQLNIINRVLKSSLKYDK